MRFKKLSEKKHHSSNSYTIEYACVHATRADFMNVNVHNAGPPALTASVSFICQTIPPIPKSCQSPPQEYESSLSKEESLATSTRSTSGPSSPRNPAVGEVNWKADLLPMCVLCEVQVLNWSTISYTLICRWQNNRPLKLTRFIWSIQITWLCYSVSEERFLFSRAAHLCVGINCESAKG